MARVVILFNFEVIYFMSIPVKFARFYSLYLSFICPEIILQIFMFVWLYEYRCLSPYIITF